MLTTIIAFLSLIFSEIKPIIDLVDDDNGFNYFNNNYFYASPLINFVPKENISLKEYKNSKITILSQGFQNNQKSIFSLQASSFF